VRRWPGQCIRRAGADGARRWLVATAFSCLTPATASEILVTQDGSGNLAGIEQTASNAQARIDQRSIGGRVYVLQGSTQEGTVAIEQEGTHNLLVAGQLHAHGSSIEALQEGTGNRASLAQMSTGNGAASHRLAVRQAGVFNAIDATQHGTGANGVIVQTPLAFGTTAVLLQGGIASTAVIEQGATGAPHLSFAITAEAQRARDNQVEAAPVANAMARIVQGGGLGLAALIIQSGDGPSAAITQSGTYLEAEILQSGARHMATVLQVGNGSPGNPFRASVTQSGLQPQHVNVQQISGASPRIIRVTQQ
jgi:hypothetical protein